MNLINLSIPAAILTAILSIFSPSGNNLPAAHWVDGETYVYYTAESATFTGETDGVAYFETGDGNVWAAYIYDSDLQAGESVTLTFENAESRSEYYQAQEYGIETVTRIDNGRIISID